MRFAFVVSRALGYHIPNLFDSDESFEDFDKALELLEQNGFDGVELNLNLHDQNRLARIEDCIKSHGLRLSSVGTGLIYARDNLSFTDSESSKRERAISIVKKLIEFASGEKAPVIIGLIRGAGKLDIGEASVYLRDSLMECDSVAHRNGVRMALEAINRYETPLLNAADEVSIFIRNGKLDATGILLDTFHMNIEERSIEETIRRYFSEVVHFHIADSNRWPPGFGHMKIEDSLRLLQDLGYDGWVSAETLPKPNNAEAVRATASFLRTHRFM